MLHCNSSHTSCAYSSLTLSTTQSKRFVTFRSVPLQFLGLLLFLIPSHGFAFQEDQVDETGFQKTIVEKKVAEESGQKTFMVQLDQSLMRQLRSGVQLVSAIPKDQTFEKFAIRLNSQQEFQANSNVELFVTTKNERMAFSGKLQAEGNLSLVSEFAEMSIPWNEIAAIKVLPASDANADGSSKANDFEAIVACKNGDRVSGKIEQSSIELETSWGTAIVELNKISEVKTEQNYSFVQQSSPEGITWQLIKPIDTQRSSFGNQFNSMHSNSPQLPGSNGFQRPSQPLNTPSTNRSKRTDEIQPID